MGSDSALPLPPTEALAAALARVLAEGLAKYGLARLPAKIFEEAAIEALAERLVAGGLPPTPRHMNELLPRIPGPDFVLWIAARHGDREEAMAAFRRIHAARLAACYRYFGAEATEAEDLTVEALEALTFGAFRRSQTPAFFTYEAKAPIESWLAGYVWYDWSNRNRARGRHHETADANLDPERTSPLVAAAAVETETPEARELGAMVYAAMVRAVEQETVPARDLIAYCGWILSPLPQQELAAQLEVDPATFSRRKTRAQEALGAAVKEELLLRLSGPEYLLVGREVNLELSESNLHLYQTIREFCRWAWRRFQAGGRLPDIQEASD